MSAGGPALAGSSYKMVAGVSWYGPCDFEKTDLFNHDDREGFRDRFGPRILKPDTKPEDKLALYREMSPINYLTKNSPPLLMIQGDKDTTIPVEHAYYMQGKAESLQAPVEIMIIKNAGHNWREVDASGKWLVSVSGLIFPLNHHNRRRYNHSMVAKSNFLSVSSKGSRLEMSFS